MMCYRYLAIPVLLLMVFLSACAAPAVQPGTPTAVAGVAATPTPMAAPFRTPAIASPVSTVTPAATISPEVQQAIQQLPQIQDQLEQLQQAVQQVPPEDLRRFATTMAAFTGRMGELLRELGPLMSGLTPAERQAADATLASMQQQVLSMRQTLQVAETPAAATPTASPTPSDVAQSLSQTQQLISQQAEQLSAEQLQAVTQHAGGLVGDLQTLLAQATPALTRIRPEQQPRLAGTISEMNVLLQQMLQMAGIVIPTPTPR